MDGHAYRVIPAPDMRPDHPGVGGLSSGSERGCDGAGQRYQAQKQRFKHAVHRHNLGGRTCSGPERVALRAARPSGPTYPHYTSYPQADSGCATRVSGPACTCSQNGRPATEESSKLLPPRKRRSFERTIPGKRMAGRARKKREAEAQADAAPTFRTVQQNRSLRAKGKRKRLRRNRDISFGDSLGTGEAAMPGWKPEREPVLGSQDLQTGS
jgi:hypothetical protein